MKTRMLLSLKMSQYFLTTASLSSGEAKAKALFLARRELARYWAIK